MDSNDIFAQTEPAHFFKTEAYMRAPCSHNLLHGTSGASKHVPRNVHERAEHQRCTLTNKIADRGGIIASSKETMVEESAPCRMRGQLIVFRVSAKYATLALVALFPRKLAHIIVVVRM